MRKSQFLVARWSVVAAAFLCMAAPAPGQETIEENKSDRWIWRDGYGSNYWLGSTFNGTFQRDFAVNDFRVWVKSTVGGFDTGVAPWNGVIPIDDLPDDFFVYSKMSVSGDGNGGWWYGPKMGIGGGPHPGGFECYVFENSSRSADDWHDLLLNGGREYLGFTVHDGGVYRHYRGPDPTGSWMMYWAIRTRYRTSGSVSTPRIAQFWRTHGMPNEDLGRTKINIETNSDQDRQFRFFDYYIPKSYAGSPDRDYIGEDLSGVKRIRFVRNTPEPRYLNTGAKKDGAGVHTAPLNPRWGSQKWEFIPAGGASYHIQNVWTKRYLTDASQGEGRVTLESFTGNADQTWTVGIDGDARWLISHDSARYAHTPIVNGEFSNLISSSLTQFPNAQRYAIEDL